MDYDFILLTSGSLTKYMRRGALGDLTPRVLSLVTEYFAARGFEDMPLSADQEDYAQFYFDLVDVIQEYAKPGSELCVLLNSCTPTLCKSVNTLYIHLHPWDNDDLYFQSLSRNLFGLQRIH